MVLMSFCVPRTFAFCRAVMALGMSRAARMPMMATTMSSSMRVKPFCFLSIEISLCLDLAPQLRDTLFIAIHMPIPNCNIINMM